MKIDIEYSEWACFKTIFKQRILDNVKQLVFETHTPELWRGKKSTREDYNRMAGTLFEIEKLGFRRFHFHENPSNPYISKVTGKVRRCCYELHYVNLKYLH